MQRYKNIMKNFCHDQQRWGGGNFLDFVGESSWVPPLVRENPVSKTRNIRRLILRISPWIQGEVIWHLEIRVFSVTPQQFVNFWPKAPFLVKCEKNVLSLHYHCQNDYSNNFIFAQSYDYFREVASFFVIFGYLAFLMVIFIIIWSVDSYILGAY